MSEPHAAPSPSSCRLNSVLFAGTMLVVGCGSSGPDPNSPWLSGAPVGGAKVEPASSTEKEILAQLERLPPGQARVVGNVSVSAERPYVAASGRTCRHLRISAQGQQRGQSRLACKEAGPWFYVPDVFAPTGDGR